MYAYEGALTALGRGYDETNILSMHPQVQELLTQQDKLPRQELIQKLPEELRKLQEKGAGKVSGRLTPEEKEANRICLLIF